MTQPLHRRDLLRRGVVFGLTGAALSAWAPPSLASLSPPAALGGSQESGGGGPRAGSGISNVGPQVAPQLSWEGPRGMTIRSSTRTANVRMWLVGRDFQGSMSVSVKPPKTPPGVSIQVTVRPAGVQFTGKKIEAYPVTYTYRVAGNPRKIGSLDLDYVLEARSGENAILAARRNFRLSINSQ